MMKKIVNIHSQVIAPIIAEGDAIGAVIILSKEPGKNLVK